MSCRVLNAGTGDVIQTGKRKVTARVLSDGPIGVTFVSPGYEHLEKEAVSRFREMTGGLECLVIHTGTLRGSSFAAKLNLDLLVAPRPIVFFDADLWFIRPFDFASLGKSDQWCAVPDPCSTNLSSFCGQDSKREGWEVGTYFNSGLFVCDLARPEIRRVFADARAQLDRVIRDEVAPPVDSTDQYYLNWAVHQQPGLFKPLPLAMNFFAIAIHHGSLSEFPANIIGLHAAGVHLNRKLETLTRQAWVFAPPEGGIFHHAGTPAPNSK